MDSGWIKIHRKIMDWDWYTDDVTKSIYLHLLLTANYEKKSWRGITIEPGERVISINGLAEETQHSKQQTRTALDKLKATHEITLTPTHKYTIVKVLNYRLYQGLEELEQHSDQHTEQHSINTVATRNATQSATTTKEIKNKELKNKEKDFKKHIPVSGETASTPKQEKHKYGEYGHVFLTDGERDRLFNDYGEAETMKAIKYLDDCIEMKGYKYKSHNLALRKWVFNALKEDELRKQKFNGNLRSGRQQTGEGFLDGIADWVSKNQEGGTDDGCGAIW